MRKNELKILDELLRIKIRIKFCRISWSRREIFGDSCRGADNLIRINLSRHHRLPPGRTFVHELLHLKFPEWSNEKKVLAMEKRLWKIMGWRYKYRFYRKMFTAKTIWEEEE